MEKARRRRKVAVSTILVRPVPGNRSRAIVQLGPLRLPAAIGRSGRSAIKREGDGATPISTMKLLYGFMRGDRIRSLTTPLSLRRTGADMAWCDAPADPNYNRPVKRPFRPSHEEMTRADGLYDICLVLDWNITERRRNRGSAIFFHLIRPGYEPTAGCIAVSLADMKRLAPFLHAGRPVKVI